MTQGQPATTPSQSPQQLLGYGLGGSRAYGLYYQHSGAVTFVGPLMGFAVGVPAAIAMGIAYAWADVYVPLIYLNILLAMAFGAAAAVVPAWIMRRGKVRNVAVTMSVVLLVTIVGYYTAWVAWVDVVLQRAYRNQLPSFGTWLIAKDLLVSRPGERSFGVPQDDALFEWLGVK